MKPMKLLVLSIVALLFVSGCKIQTVQQYEDEKNEDMSKVVVVDEEKNENTNENIPANKTASEGEIASSAQTNVSEKAETLQAQSTMPQQSAQDPVNHVKSTSTKEEKEDVAEAKETKNGNVASPTKPSTSSTVKSEPTQAAPKKEVVKVDEEKKSDATVPKTPAKAPESKPKPVVKPIKKEYVTVSITMDLLLQEENRKKLPEALQSTKYIPANGVVLNSKVEIKEGASAWDAILALCQAKNIHIDYEYSSTFGGIYIKGISHIYEFSAGQMSGWMYSVNGKKAPVGVSGYELEDKDVIALKYTVNGGSDLGW